METELLQIASQLSPNHPEPQEPTPKKRRNTIDRIRTSLKAVPLLSANQDMVRSRINSRSTVDPLENDTDSSPTETTEIKSEVFKAELFQEKYELFQKLGEGTSGVVYRCKKRRTGDEFASKSFKFQQQHLPSLKANFLVLNRLKHPNIIKYQGLYLDIKKLSGWLVMELVNWSSLDKVKLTSEDDLKEVMKKLLQTLKYLHKHDIVHRDIKSENILFDGESKEIKVIDFGIARRCRRRGTLFDMLTITGTLFYRAPEMFSGGYREGVDVWAAGVLLYQMACGKTPFESEYHHQTINNITHQNIEFPSEFDAFSSKMKALIKKMLNRDCEDRLSASECLKNSWFSYLTSPLFKRQATTRHSDDDSPSLANKTHYHRKPSKEAEDKQRQNSKVCQFSLTKCQTLSSVCSYVKKIKGDQFYCIDSDSEK